MVAVSFTFEGAAVGVVRFKLDVTYLFQGGRQKPLKGDLLR
jgi:hypothetical protein